MPAAPARRCHRIRNRSRAGAGRAPRRPASADDADARRAPLRHLSLSLRKGAILSLKCATSQPPIQGL
jgi:hypothetical protein